MKYPTLSVLFVLCSLPSFCIGHIYNAPHFSHREGEWETHLVLQNTGSQKASVNLAAYSPSGVLLATNGLWLEPDQILAQRVAAFFKNLSAETGWLDIRCIQSSLDVHLEFYRLSDASFTSLAVDETTGTLGSFSLQQNQPNQTTGLVLINPNLEQAVVNLYLKDLEGTETFQNRILIPPFNQVKGPLEHFFTEPIPTQSQLSYVSTQPLQGFALLVGGQAQQLRTTSFSVSNPRLNPDLEALASRLVAKTPFGGISINYREGDQNWSALKGISDRDSRQALHPHDALNVGRASFPIISTLLLIYQDEGLVDLDETLDQWLPDFPRASALSLRRLMNHTSGLVDYQVTGDFYGRQNPQDLDEALTTEELLASVPLSGDQGFLSLPGTHFTYSSTNYLLLCQVIERLTGNSVASELHSRIFGPLGMEHTFLASQEPAPYRAIPYDQRIYPGSPAQGNSIYGDSIKGACASLVSTSEDLGIFLQALMKGELLSENAIREMETSSATPEYQEMGLGIYTYSYGGSTFNMTLELGWTGFVVMVWCPQTKKSAVFLGSQTDMIEVCAEMHEQGNKWIGAY